MIRSGLLLLVFATACGGSQSHRVYRLPSACNDAVDSAEAQHCAGWLLDEMMTVRLGVYDDAELLDYVRRVGNHVAEQSNRSDISWTFRILDEPGVQAWAAPEGHVYVTRGLLSQIDSEAELAAVLGHEIGHVAAGHTDVLLDNLPEPSLSAYDWAFSFRLSQDDEAQADQLAVRYLRRAGYDPGAVRSMLLAIHRAEGEGEHSWLARHPPLPVRLALTARAAGSTTGGRLDRETYLRQIEGLVVGHDPRQGRIVGQRFVHERAGFSFVLPEGWTDEPWEPGTIRSQWFSAWSEDEQSAVALLPVSTTYGEVLEVALTEDMLERPTRRSRLGDFDALQGTFEYDAEDSEVRFTGGSGLIHAAIFEADDDRSYILIVRSAEESGRPVADVFRGIVRTLRRHDEASDSPLRLQLRQVPERMTLSQLAEAGCAPEGQAQLIDHLNEHALDATLEVGGTVKCLAR